MKYIVVFITTGGKGEARKISETLLKKRVIACANIVKDIESMFWWEGRRQKSKECLIIAKTLKTSFKKLVDIVISSHSYECPEIIAIPIAGGFKPYMDWLDREIR